MSYLTESARRRWDEYQPDDTPIFHALVRATARRRRLDRVWPWVMIAAALLVIVAMFVWAS